MRIDNESDDRQPDKGVSWLAMAVAAMTCALVFQSYAPRSASADRVDSKPASGVETPETAIRLWPALAQAAARAMIDKYGEPDDFTEQGLSWRNNGPWLETVVYREPRTHLLLMPDRDYLKQTIRYHVPKDMIADLKRFERKIDVDMDNGKLSSQSESESMNYLTLNLADEIIAQRRSVEDARAFYFKTKRLAENGKTSPYLSGFLFVGSTINTAY